MKPVKLQRGAMWLLLAAAVLIIGVSVSLLAGSSHKTRDSADVESFLARKERWGAKTGAADDAAIIAVATPAQVTVNELTQLSRPDGMPSRGGPGGERYGAVEHTVYVIDAKLLRYKCEEDDDRDDHLVITDYGSPGPTMIVEIPDPSAVSVASPWHDRIAEARRTFDAAFSPTGRFTRRTAHIRVTGVGFFDFFHRQSGVAPNCIELHPVIGIEVLD
jgi:hypothetical protein